MEKRLICTMACGEESRQIQELTLPYLIKYAKKCDADLHIQYAEDKRYEWIGRQKSSYRELLQSYDRLVHIDADVFVKPNCPSLFDVVPQGKFAAVDESKVVLPYDGDRLAHMREVMKDWGLEHIPDYGIYFNNGVFLIPSDADCIFDEPEERLNRMFYDQTENNIALVKYKIHFHELDYRFNFMWVHEKSGYNRDDAYNIHYAGRLGGLSIDKLCDRIKEDIRRYG